MPSISTGKFHSRTAAKQKVSGDHAPEQCNHKLNGQFIHHKPLRATEGKEKVVAMFTDGAKQLFVPKREPIDRPAILPQSEFERLTQKAHVTTLEDKMKMIEESEQQKTREVMESTKRKEELLRIQQPQKAPPGSKLETVESEAAKKNLYLLRRSQELMIEQDERVKQANGIILATKCRAIRNAQLAEKKLLKKQLKEEEQRLDAMMEQQRQKKIQIEEEKRAKEEEKKERYVQEIQQQMKENELDRLLEAERVEEESRMLNNALIQLQKEEIAAMQEKKEKQLRMREEFRKANEEAEKYKCLRTEEQRIAELRRMLGCTETYNNNILPTEVTKTLSLFFCAMTVIYDQAISTRQENPGGRGVTHKFSYNTTRYETACTSLLIGQVYIMVLVRDLRRDRPLPICTPDSILQIDLNLYRYLGNNRHIKAYQTSRIEQLIIPERKERLELKTEHLRTHIQEFMRQKALREQEREREHALIKASKEKEIARLRALQEKSQDLKAALDEMQAMRSQEEKEREWREQEKQAALRKLNMIKDLHASRNKQIEDIRKSQANALARDEEDFKKVAMVQHKLLQKDLEKREKQKQEIARHRKELLKQINEKERERIKWQQEKFEDGKAQRLEFMVKDRNVEDYLRQKIEKLKLNNLPQQYIKDIERQLKL